MAHRMLKTNRGGRWVEMYAQLFPNIAFNPISQGQQLILAQIISVHIGFVTSLRVALVIVGREGVIQFDSMEPVPVVGINPGTFLGFMGNGMIEIETAGIGGDYGNVEFIGRGLKEPIMCGPDGFLRLARMSDGHQGFHLEPVSPGNFHATGIFLARSPLVDVFENPG